MKNEPDLTISATQIAKIVGVNRLTAIRMLEDGRIKGERVEGTRQWNVKYKELMKMKNALDIVRK